MRTLVTTFAFSLAAAGALASEDEARKPDCPAWALQPCVVAPQHREAERVWDPNLAQWRVEHPRRVWDPNLAQYRVERRDEVWDPNLARYRPRDERTDGPAPERERRERRPESRRRR